MSDFSHEANVRDLEAVMAQIDTRPVVFFGQTLDCPTVIDYSLRHPGEAAALVLWNPQAGGTLSDGFGQQVGLLALAKVDWEFFIDVFSHWILGWRHDELTEHEKELIRRSVTQEGYIAFWEQFAAAGASDTTLDHLYRQIDLPTLVIYRRNSPASQAARAVAASMIPNVQQVGLDGTANPMWAEDIGAVVEAMKTFLNASPAAPSPSHHHHGAVVHTILFTDLESSTALTQAVGDAKAQDVLHAHNEVVRKALTEHDGNEVKHTGDGIMASFSSAVSAVEAAQQIQRDLAGADIRVRIGLNAGEPIVENRDFFGTAVQLAARICDRAEPGQVLVSRVVMDLCAGKTFTFEDVGAATLKGFNEPVGLYAVDTH